MYYLSLKIYIPIKLSIIFIISLLSSKYPLCLQSKLCLPSKFCLVPFLLILLRDITCNVVGSPVNALAPFIFSTTPFYFCICLTFSSVFFLHSDTKVYIPPIPESYTSQSLESTWAITEGHHSVRVLLASTTTSPGCARNCSICVYPLSLLYVNFSLVPQGHLN